MQRQLQRFRRLQKACATKLHSVCRQDCKLAAEPTCTDSCTVQCSQDCDRGVNVICIHNCFKECSVGCDLHCVGSEDPEQCVATCSANCDGECDIKCKPLIDGSCYQHCVECCGGSCQAQSNLDCQTTCQDELFETCEYEFKANCDASCKADGALFCDGEYVLSGAQMPACVQALVTRGIGSIDAKVDVDVDSGKAAASGNAGCSIGRSMVPAGGSAVAWLVLHTSWLLRRRRSRKLRG